MSLRWKKGAQPTTCHGGKHSVALKGAFVYSWAPTESFCSRREARWWMRSEDRKPKKAPR